MSPGAHPGRGGRVARAARRRTVDATRHPDHLVPAVRAQVHLEPGLCTVDECVGEAQRSFTALVNLLDARLVGGDASLLDELVAHTTAPLRHDRMALRRHLAPLVQRRHAGHAAVTVAAVPDLHNGRGGVRDVQTLRWLEPLTDQRVLAALDFQLRLASSVEEASGHAAHRFTPRLQERAAAALGLTGLTP